MIIYFKVKKALGNLQKYLCNEYFECLVEDANSVVFKPSNLYAYVKTKTDIQKEKLISSKEVQSKFRECLSQAGIPKDVALHLSLYIESEETVEREWAGNWFYALFK